MSNNNNKEFVNSERFDEENNISAKGEKISLQPSKGRTRRSAVNLDDPLSNSNTATMYKESLNYKFNEDGNILDAEDTSSDDWISDFKSNSRRRNFLDRNNNKVHKYLSDSDDSGNFNVLDTNKKSTSLSVSNDEENSLLDSENDNTTNEDDSVSIYYDTCLACKEQQENCEESLNQLYSIFREIFFSKGNLLRCFQK